jgi:hypothetical protein
MRWVAAAIIARVRLTSSFTQRAPLRMVSATPLP